MESGFLLRILRKKWIFFILFPEQVENVFTISRLKVIKRGGLTKQVCFHVFCYSMNN